MHFFSVLKLIAGIVLVTLAENEIYSSIVSETLEVCHGSNFYVNILLDAITKKISVNIPPLHQSNTILTCSFSSGKEPLCINVQTVQYKFNQTSKILMFYMKYHHREHAEKALFVNSTRHNGTTSSRKIILLPCQADFEAKATHNKTHVTITCKNRSFNQSSGMQILQGGNTVSQCQWNKTTPKLICISAKGLADGILKTTKHDPRIKYRCAMDGQIVQINYTEESIVLKETRPPLLSSSKDVEPHEVMLNYTEKPNLFKEKRSSPSNSSSLYEPQQILLFTCFLLICLLHY